MAPDPLHSGWDHVMGRWTRNSSGRRRLELGHGLELLIWEERLITLRRGEPRFNISVFGQVLVTRSDNLQEAKRRAEDAARRWMHEVLLRLSGLIT